MWSWELGGEDKGVYLGRQRRHSPQCLAEETEFAER